MEEEKDIADELIESLKKPVNFDTKGKLLLAGIIISILIITWVLGYKMGIKATNGHWQTITEGCEMFLR